MSRSLRAALVLAAFVAATCARGGGEAQPGGASPASRTTLGGVDLTKHGVPLEDIHFDTFAGGSIPLSEITAEQQADLLDAIPPLSDPEYDDAAGGDWLDEDDAVIGYVAGEAAYAYPFKILNYHEIVNDDLGGFPILVTYCPLCRSGIVYDRRVEGRTLDFGNTSALYESDLVMVDRQTNSYWWQVAGEAIVGTLTGTRLAVVPSMTLTWGAWKGVHPETKVLSRDTGYGRPYESDPFGGYENTVTAGRFPFPVSDAGKDDRLAAGEEVLGVAVRGESAAYPLGRLGDAAVNERVGGQPVVVFSSERGPAGAAFSARIEGMTLTFRSEGGAYRDDQTGSTWDFLGRAIAGPLAGSRLDPFPSRHTFWFAYVAAFPETRVFTG
jgi:hypothetical protein